MLAFLWQTITFGRPIQYITRKEVDLVEARRDRVGEGHGANPT
jgi:hypothetical protein